MRKKVTGIDLRDRLFQLQLEFLVVGEVHGEGLAQRHRGDAELRGELRLRRELLAVREQAELYRLADAERDFLRPAEDGQRGDE